MIGVVMCGGQSSRMGADKAMINTSGTSWAQSSIDRLSTLKLAIYLSVNQTQYTEYSLIFNESKLIKDDQSLQLHGPLLGVISAHLKFPLQDLFVLACDMQSMETIAISKLQDCYALHPNYEAYVYVQENNREPLCAIYSATALQKIVKMNTDKTLKKHSMNFMLDQLTVFEIQVLQDQKDLFKNYNSPSDL